MNGNNDSPRSSHAAKQTLEELELELVLDGVGGIGRQPVRFTLIQRIEVELGVHPLLIGVETALREVERVKESLVDHGDSRYAGVEVGEVVSELALQLLASPLQVADGFEADAIVGAVHCDAGVAQLGDLGLKPSQRQTCVSREGNQHQPTTLRTR